MKTKMNAKEEKAIETVKLAIELLPNSIFIRIDENDGTIEFLKKRGRGFATSVSEPMHIKRAVSMPTRRP